MLAPLVAIAVATTAPDPFATHPGERVVFHAHMCGSVRPLNTIRQMFIDMGYDIMDDVVMDYWESHDEVTWWTPLCSARHDFNLH